MPMMASNLNEEYAALPVGMNYLVACHPQLICRMIQPSSTDLSRLDGLIEPERLKVIQR
jgi:hypothetical protein